MEILNCFRCTLWRGAVELGSLQSVPEAGWIVPLALLPRTDTPQLVDGLIDGLVAVVVD